MSRPIDHLVRAYDARGARRKARLARAKARKQRDAMLRAKRRARRAETAQSKGRRVMAKYLKTLQALPTDARAAYDEASPAVRRLIIEQARDDALLVIKQGPSFDDVLAWKEA